MKKNIIVFLLSTLLVLTIIPAFAHTTKVTITFTDRSSNPLLEYSFPIGETIYIVDNYGNKLKEYVVRQQTQIILPEINKKAIIEEWEVVEKNGAFYLKPNLTFYIPQEEPIIEDSESNIVFNFTPKKALYIIFIFIFLIIVFKIIKHFISKNDKLMKKIEEFFDYY